MKQTAVGYLQSIVINGNHITPEDLEYAIKLERQQIISAVIYGNRQEVYDGTETIGEQYYNKTYND